MKTIVSLQEVDEFEIKPPSEVSEWRRLVEAEIGSEWKDRTAWVVVSCPCGAEGPDPAVFVRMGFSYAECTSCGTVYAPERPPARDLRVWYRDSAPARFWRDQILPASFETRLEKIVLPRLQWVNDGIAEYVPHASRLLDVSAYGRPLVDALVAGHPDLEARIVGTAADLDGDSTARVSVAPTDVEDWARLGRVHLLTAIDAFDRASDLRALVRSARDSLEIGGVLFATTPVASGFEIQSLWDRSPTILPPDKLNLPTVGGLLKIFSSDSWEVLELSTPGNFDVEIVCRTILGSPDVAWPRVLRAMVDGANADDRRQLTEYLQSRRLTSFARLVARRVN